MAPIAPPFPVRLPEPSINSNESEDESSFEIQTDNSSEARTQITREGKRKMHGRKGIGKDKNPIRQHKTKN